MKKILIGIVVFIVVIFIIGAVSGSDTTQPTGQPATTEETTEQPKAEGVTMEKFSQLQTGMTYDEAVAILGAEGEEISSSGVAGYETVMYQWDGEPFASNMNATFQNGKLMSKAQFGLE